jgi:hypothetical protein
MLKFLDTRELARDGVTDMEAGWLALCREGDSVLMAAFVEGLASLRSGGAPA